MKFKLFILLTCMVYVSKPLAKSNEEIQNYNKKTYENQLSKLLNKLNDITGVPGFSVAVVHKDELVASVATGYSDVKNKIAAQSHTTFRLASVSKIVGATMLAELVVNGQLNPDANIGKLYPELNKKYHNITVRQLLSHTSGMPHYQTKDFDIYDEHFYTANEAIKTLKGRDLLSRPGTDYHYSTHGYTLAGALYEKITQRTLTLSVKDFMFRWTAKATPAVENINELDTQSSKLYTLNKSGAKEIEHGEKSYSIFGAGLYATATDLAVFGSQVLKKAKTHKPYQQLLFTPTLTQDGTPVATRNFKVGFGWRIAKDSHERIVYHHAGATPGARSILAVYPEHNLSIAFLSNSSWVSSIDKLVFSLAGLYIDKAKIETLASTQYQVKYKDKQLTGKTRCQQGQCFLTDTMTEYSHWLNSFNKSKDSIEHWPVFAYSTEQGQRLLMVNKVGITEFEGKNNLFLSDTTKDKTYSIQLINTR